MALLPSTGQTARALRPGGLSFASGTGRGPGLSVEWADLPVTVAGVAPTCSPAPCPASFRVSPQAETSQPVASRPPAWPAMGPPAFSLRRCSAPLGPEPLCGSPGEKWLSRWPRLLPGPGPSREPRPVCSFSSPRLVALSPAAVSCPLCLSARSRAHCSLLLLWGGSRE